MRNNITSRPWQLLAIGRLWSRLGWVVPRLQCSSPAGSLGALSALHRRRFPPTGGKPYVWVHRAAKRNRVSLRRTQAEELQEALERTISRVTAGKNTLCHYVSMRSESMWLQRSPPHVSALVTEPRDFANQL